MFTDRSVLLKDNPIQRHYGIAVTDVDGDGRFEFFVAGFGSGNLVLKWDGRQFVDVADPVLADDKRFAIGVAACDLDADGREELYVLNTDTFAGRKAMSDRLFDQLDGQWVDLFTYRSNLTARNMTAGRSVACVDRNGDGWYGFFVANYGGPMRLYELDEDGTLVDVAPQAGVDMVTGGRSVIAAPLLSDRVDIFAANENGPNFLFLNRGNGTFVEVAHEHGLEDPFEHGRGLTILDANQDGLLDILYGNWDGPHRLFVRHETGRFVNMAPPKLAAPSLIRTVIAADFDNDGYEELFFNNIGEPNRLFGWRDGSWRPVPMGDAREPHGLGTGAAVGDFDGDGRLELLVAHGESGRQPLALYHTTDLGYNWLRILPLTRYGAPARGALVTLTTPTRRQVRVIDAGSGYLCQMEPVAHFGLGLEAQVEQITIRWPDGSEAQIDRPAINQLLTVPYRNLQE